MCLYYVLPIFLLNRCVSPFPTGNWNPIFWQVEHFQTMLLMEYLLLGFLEEERGTRGESYCSDRFIDATSTCVDPTTARLLFSMRHGSIGEIYSTTASLRLDII